MDHWDPAVTDGFAKNREVILFNNAGVSSSSGEVPATFADMGANAVAFIKALGLTKVDVLGFSIGGFVAQEITLAAPESRSPPGAGGDRAARRRGHGGRDAGRQPHLRRELRPARSPLAQRFLHAVGSEPGGRPRVSQALSTAFKRIAIPK